MLILMLLQTIHYHLNQERLSDCHVNPEGAEDTKKKMILFVIVGTAVQISVSVTVSLLLAVTSHLFFTPTLDTACKLPFPLLILHILLET